MKSRKMRARYGRHEAHIFDRSYDATPASSAVEVRRYGRAALAQVDNIMPQ